ncbi:MAG: (2Fe-2S)-binding protein, partial [Planctomycetaceae bacterium]|nr:(2Fe-2S)-binding protein [Planctomycetaceae bacterium]
AKSPLYNGISKAIHCRGLGTCGTCAVKINGKVSAPTSIEKWRLSIPPHRRDSGLRLACQCRVMGDLEITKFSGLWGSQTSPEP